MRILLICLLALGCEKEAVSSSSTNNPSVPVSLLFEHDGCKIYRFADGRYHYFATCPGLVIASQAESCGKGCTTVRDEEVPTVVK